MTASEKYMHITNLLIKNFNGSQMKNIILKALVFLPRPKHTDLLNILDRANPKTAEARDEMVKVIPSLISRHENTAGIIKHMYLRLT